MHTVPHSLAFPDCVPPQSHNHFLFPSEDRGGGPVGQGQGCSSTPRPPAPPPSGPGDETPVLLPSLLPSPLLFIRRDSVSAKRRKFVTNLLSLRSLSTQHRYLGRDRREERRRKGLLEQLRRTMGGRGGQE